MSNNPAPQLKDIFTDEDGDVQTITKVVGKGPNGTWEVEYEHYGWPVPVQIKRDKGRLVQVAEA